MLQLVQQACGELGLPIPATVAGNAAQSTIQLLANLNAVGNDLMRQYEWQAIDKEYRFTTQYVTTTGTTTNASAIVTAIPSTTGLDATYMAIGTGINTDVYVLTVDSSTQVTLSQPSTATGSGVALSFCKTKYAFPSDYDRPVDRTQWDKSKHWEMLGPETAQQWQWLKSGFIATGPRIRFRPLGGYFQTWPPIATPEYLGFEYISNQWAYAGTTGKSAFTIDSDTCIFPDRLMVTGLKLKFWQIKGFDTTALAYDYTMQLDVAKANDSGSQTLSFAPSPTDQLISWGNIPDSGYGS